MTSRSRKVEEKRRAEIAAAMRWSGREHDTMRLASKRNRERDIGVDRDVPDEPPPGWGRS